GIGDLRGARSGALLEQARVAKDPRSASAGAVNELVVLCVEGSTGQVVDRAAVVQHDVVRTAPGNRAAVVDRSAVDVAVGGAADRQERTARYVQWSCTADVRLSIPRHCLRRCRSKRSA